jgi:hypothetical protein
MEQALRRFERDIRPLCRANESSPPDRHPRPRMDAQASEAQLFDRILRGVDGDP